MISVEKAKQLKKQQLQIQQDKSLNKYHSVNIDLAKNSEKRRQDFIAQYIKTDAQQLQIKQKILNGIYSSSHVDLHNFRDNDPKLSNYIKLKDVLPGSVRAQNSQSDFLKNYIVNQNQWRNGPIRKILRDQEKSQEKSRNMQYGTHSTNETERINKHISENHVDWVPPANRDLMCNPNWRENVKNKWTSEKGFVTGLKQKFFDTAQAWKEPEVGNKVSDPYKEGYFNVGHEYRPRQHIQEQTYNNGKYKAPMGFDTATKHKVLHPPEFLIQSQSNRTLDSFIRLKEIHDAQVKYDEEQKLQEEEKQKRNQQFDKMKELGGTITGRDLEPEVVVVSDLDSQIVDKFRGTNSGMQSVRTSYKQSSLQSSIVLKKNQSQSTLTGNSKEENARKENPNREKKLYLKSIEGSIPFGYLGSNIYKDEQLSESIRNLRQASQQYRPMTAKQVSISSVQSKVLMQISSLEQIIEKNMRQSPKLHQIIESPIRPISSVKKKSLLSIDMRPMSAVMTQCSSNEKLSNRPQSGIYSISSGSFNGAKLGNFAIKRKSNQSFKQEAVSKYFDKIQNQL